MHPIHYSLILNIIILAVTGFIAYSFKEPLLVVVALLLANHSMAKFQDGDSDDEDDDGGDEPKIGFLTK